VSSDPNLLTPKPGTGLQVVVRRTPELYLPRSARKTEYHCAICPRKFPEEQVAQFHKHIKDCSAKHDDAIQEEIQQRRNDPLLNPADREQHEFWRSRRKAMKGLVGH